ncbi:MAG: hypothetical protein KAX31_05720 [Thermoplasmata archaeon]|nr:hypothetical protein [Thermoplasmata archaeon]
MNQYLTERNKRMLYGFIGFGVPAIFILLQVFFSFGTLPLMVLMMSWFGMALFIYLGLSEE